MSKNRRKKGSSSNGFWGERSRTVPRVAMFTTAGETRLIMGASVGTFPIFNWLLFGYGVPALAFLAAGHILKTERDDLAARLCDALGVLLAGLLVFFEIRHALNGGDPLANTSGHVEQGLFALMSIGFAYALMRLDLGRANPVFHFASLAFGVLSAVFIVFGLGIVENPLLSSDRILGIPVFSSLLLAYQD